MSELQELKRKLFEEERIHELLEFMGCEQIKEKSNRFEAQLPDKFDSNNSRAVQCYKNIYLTCRIRSRGVTKLDIYGLVSYIVFDILNENAQLKNIPKSKKWICEKLGYSSSNVYQPIKDDPLQWLKDLRKSRKKKSTFQMQENEIFEESILNQYIMYPYKEYIDQGIEYKTQLDFQVGYDIQTERIIFPIYNSFGDIISIKGRTSHETYKEKGIYKFIYLYNFNKMIEWYNWHKAIYFILERKEVIIFESEKSCWLATQFNYENCVAIGGDDISDYQINTIKELGSEIKVVIALDKDKSVEDIKKQAAKFGMNRLVYTIWDSKHLLVKGSKNSPLDLGSDIWEQLYKNHKHRVENSS